MSIRLHPLLLTFFTLFFSLTVYAQHDHDHDHDHDATHKVQAEQIWNTTLSKDKIRENIERAQLFQRAELDKLLFLFEQRYVQDRSYYYTVVGEKDQAGLQQHCDSMSRVYKQLFEDYNTNKAYYLKEADKVLAINRALQNKPLTVNGPCANVDFEDGSTNGWDGFVGYACTNPTPCGLVAGMEMDRHLVLAGGYDPIVGGTTLPVVAPGGNYSLRLEDLTSGAYASRISQTFMVTAANSNFTIRYAVVLEDPVTGHNDAERPYFNVSMTDQAGASITCAEYRVIAKPPIVGFTRVIGTNYYYRDWTTVSIPLSAYIGQNVTITFDVSDCSQGAHTGYAYIDGSCLPFEIETQYSALCSNDPVTLYGPDGYASYQWSGPSIVGATNTQNVVVNQAGTYNLTMASLTGTGCNSTLTFVLSASANTFAGNDTSVCVGNSVQLTATGVGPDVVWSPATGLDNPHSATPVATPATTTTYTVTSCGVSDQVTVTVHNGFSITASPDVTLCNSTSTVLSVTENMPGNYTYLWTPAATLSTASSNTTVASPLDPTMYIVQVTGADGCVRKDTVNVTINNPITQLQAYSWPGTICNGSPATLNAVQGIVDDNCNVLNTSFWNISGGGGGSACGSVSGNAYFFNGAGTRSLTTLSWLDLTGGGFISFYLKISTGTAPCDDAEVGEDVVLEYTVNGSIWTTIAQYNEASYPFYMPVSATIPMAASIDGVKFRFRQLSSTGSGQDTWGLDNIQIVRNLVLTGNTSGLSYSWTPTTGATNPNSISTAVTPTTNTTYSLVITNATTGCSYNSSVTVNVANDFNLSLPSPVNICTGNTATLSATPTPADNYEYYWQNATNISNIYVANPVVNPTVNTTYTVMVKSPGGCIKTASTSVVVVKAPKINVTSSQNPICGLQPATLSANEVIISDTIGNTLNTTNWQMNSASVSSSCGSVSGNAITFDGAGLRILTTSFSHNTSAGGLIEFYLKFPAGSSGCDDAETGDDLVLEYFNGSWNTLATFNEAAYPNFTLMRVPLTGNAIGISVSFRFRQLNHSGANTDICILDNIKILRNLPAAYTYTYSWTPPATLNNAASSNPLATPTTDTWYVLEILSNGICPQKDSILVKVAPDFTLSVNNPTINTCVNSTTMLIAQTDLAVGNYTSIWSPEAGLDNPLSLTPELTVQGSATYQINVISAQGCQKTATVTVTPTGIGPMVNLTASKVIACPGEIINLDATIVTATCGTSGNCGPGSGNTSTRGGAGGVASQYPLAGYYHDGRTQVLYTKAELLAFGIQPGDMIKSIGFNVLAKNSSTPYYGFTVKIGCTNVATLNTGFVAGNTTVYTSTFTPVIGMNTFTLTNPYMWDGSSNLVVEFCYDNTSYTYYDYVETNTTTSNYSCAYYYADFNSGCSMTTYSATNTRPQLTFGTCSGSSNNGTFTWTPSTGLSDPNSLHQTVTVNQTVTYTIEVLSPNGCVSRRSRTITIDNSNIADVWADTTCTNGLPIPVHANFSGTAVNTSYNCNVLSALPSTTTPYSVQVGSHTYHTDVTPFFGSYTDQRTQYLYTAAELNAVGITKGAIYALSLNVTGKRSSQPYNGLTIKMGCTTNNALSASTGFLPNTYVVYTPKAYSTINGVNTFTFDQPYAWDGVSNIIVEFCWDNTYYTSGDLMSVFNTTHISVLTAISNSGAGCNLNIIESAHTSRPVATFNVYPPDPAVLSYHWTAHSGTVANPTNANTTVSTNANTWAVFTLTGGVCTVKDSVYVRPNQSPVIHIDSILNCATGEFTFNSNGDTFQSYLWSPAVSGNPADFSIIPTADMYYNLTATNDLLCTSRDSVQVRIVGDPLVLPEDTLLCEGLDITFTATGGEGYVWQLPGQAITGQNHIDFTSVEEPIPLTLLVTRHNGCIVTHDWTLDIMDSLHISLSSDRPHACMGRFTELVASGSDNYQWSPSSLFSNNEAVQNINISVDTEIKVESSNRCFTDSAKLMLVVHDIPVIAKAKDTTICYATPVYLHATYSPSYSYAWTPDQDLDHPNIYNPVAILTGTTTYVVDVSNGFCSAYDTVVVTVLDQLHAQIDASAVEGDIPFTSTLTSHYPAVSYSWYTQTNPTPFATTQQTPYQINTMGDATVYLEVTNEAGCKAVDSVYLLASYIFIPNLVTPNGDGDNDTYILVLFGHEWSITIFNRWGEQVYKNDNYHNEWGAGDVSDGMYYYEVVEHRSSRTYKGWVHVLSRKPEGSTE